MTTPTHHLHRRFLTTSVVMIVASVSESVLAWCHGPVHVLVAVPIVAIAVCGVSLARTAVLLERESKASAARVRWTSVERGTVPVRTHPNDCAVCGAWHGYGVGGPCHACHLASLAAERTAQQALRAAHYGH